MISYAMKMNCGCCDAFPLMFHNDDEAGAAVEAAGLTTNGTVTDATDYEFEGLDTFFGIWRHGEDDGQNVIGKLISQLNK